jgi:RNase P subunit RPR2
MRIKVKNIICPICHRRTYFSGKVVYESERTQVIEWKCANCGVILKSKHDKLGEKYNQMRKKRSLSARPALWIRKEATEIYFILKSVKSSTHSAP